MPTYSSWTVSGGSIDYVPIEKPVNKTVELFTDKNQGSVPPSGNTSSNTGQYILAQDGTWIPQPSFTSGGSDAFEILRPSVFTPTYSAYTPTVTNSANAYDVDTNHATTFGRWECDFVNRNLPITDTLLFTAFGSKTQTWTSATINISRAYGYFDDGESNSSSKVTSVKVEFSTNGGTSWTTIVTDLSTNVPSTATTSSYTFTTSPTMTSVQVKLTLVRGGGGMIYDPDIGTSVPGSTGDIDLKLYDIWISGTYSGGSGNITCNNLTVTGDATFQNKIYDSTNSPGTNGQVLKVASNGKVEWATDSAGTGTVTSITTTGANGVTISGGSTQTITTSGTFALALGNITPTSISTGTGSFSGDVEFAASIKSPNGSNSPIVISPDGTGDLHVNADSLRLGDNNADATIATNGTGDLILTTHEGSATQGVIRLYDGANGNITLTPYGTGQVQVGSDQVVTLTASQTLTNKSLSGSSNTFTNIPNSATTAASANTASAIVARDASGNFSAGTITATLSGNATNVTGTVAVGNGGTGLTTLTAGYIPYGNGTSAFGSSANLFWDSTNSRLGVGTTSPSYRLDIRGAATDLLQIKSSSSYTFTRFQSSSRNWALSIGNGFSVYDETAAATRLEIDSSGNTGIGVSPQARLHVLDKAKISDSSQGLGLLALGDGSSTVNNVGIWRGEANSVSVAGNWLGLGGYQGIVFTTSNTSLGSQSERMRIDSSGNLLIGNTNGTEKLTVTGKIKASDVLLGNNGTKGYGAITTTTSTSTPTGGASGDHYYIY
jgi:hypothetical protein